MKTKLASLTGLLVGIALLLAGGGESPRWLSGILVVALMFGALAYGYTLFSPRVPGWMTSRPVVGVSLIYLGVISMFLPPNVVAAAVFIGSGTRLILTSDTVRVRVVQGGTLARRETGTEVMR